MRKRYEPPSPLLHLPPELRERIYWHCFNTSTEDPQSGKSYPKDPPLSHVSKQIRNEVLPIYYANYTLPIQTYIRCSYHGQVWLRTRKWFHGLPASKLKHIRNLHIRFSLVDRYTGEFVPIEFSIALRLRTQDYTLTHAFARSWFRNPHRIGDPADFEDLVCTLRNHLTDTLDQLVERPGVGNITADHIDQLVRVDPDTLPLQTVD